MDSLSSIEAFEAVFKPALSSVSTVAIITEIVLLLYLKKGWSFKSSTMSFGCFVVTAVSGALFHITVVYYLHGWVYEHRLFDLGFAWYGWVLCFLLIDAMFYITHRMHHEIRLLWCVHAVHHSAERFELPTGIRGSFLDTASQFPVYAWLPLVGIHPLMYLITDGAFKFLIFIYHTELIGKLGVLEKIFVTPANHRVHHGTNVRYLDRNYGGVFILFDRLLRTYQPEDEQPTYGVRNKSPSSSLFTTQTREFVSLWRDIVNAPSLRAKLLYALKPPGWRHDGTGETAKDLQLALSVGCQTATSHESS
jgi:sterol desaturase/sphingolipid hydroxylase (fatty acid hydroxylase superfamily)